MAESQATYKEDLLNPLAKVCGEYCHRFWPYIFKDIAVLDDTIAILTSTTHSDLLHFFKIELLKEVKEGKEVKMKVVKQVDPPNKLRGVSLTTYQSKFAIVGGRSLSTPSELSDLISTFSETSSGDKWDTFLPCMPTKRYNTSSISVKHTKSNREVLIVAGGRDSERDLNVVEILLEKTWYNVCALPKPMRGIKFTYHDESVYAIAENKLFSCSLETLIEKCEMFQRGEYCIDSWTELIAPSYFIIISFNSRLACIDREGTMKAYCNKFQRWINVDNKEEIFSMSTYNYAIAAVLPSGDLICVCDSDIYRVWMQSETTFDQDSKFDINALSRFEAAMKVSIIPIVGDNLSMLYNSVMPLKHQPPSSNNIYEDVSLFISLWSDGPPITWKVFLQELKKLGLEELTQKIEIFFKGYDEIYNEVIKREKTVEMPFGKVIFLGPPRIGKTTTFRRIQREIIDLLSAGEADEQHSSTGVIQSGHNNIVQGAAVIGANTPTVRKFTSSASRMPFDTKSGQPQRKKSKSVKRSKSISHGEERHLSYRSRTSTEPSTKYNTQNYAQIMSFIKEFKSSALNNPETYLRLEDTGGQPELMDMLPAFTTGPGLYLLFFSYELNLKHTFPVYYQKSLNESTIPEQSAFTVEEMLLSSLSSIYCSSLLRNQNNREPDNPNLSGILGASKSIVYLVGTHKDKVSHEHMGTFDKELQGIICDTDFYHKDLVQFCSEGSLAISMNNMNGGEDEVTQICEILTKAVKKHFRKLKIPMSWYLFSLRLQEMGSRFIDKKYCIELAKSLKLSTLETEAALWFLHHRAGVLMHFPEVRGLEDLVITDVQIVYDSTTNLILEALTFEHVGEKNAKIFRETGQFLMKDLKEHDSNLIMPEKLLILLEYLHIIAPLDVHEPSSAQEIVYMMPCVLLHACDEILDQALENAEHMIATLAIRYNCGFAPTGIFPAMTASLIGNRKFHLVQEGRMYKNFVQFRYGDLHTLVSFISRPKFYEVVISELPVVAHAPDLECVKIRKEVEETFENVTSHMNYGSFTDYQFGFECPIHPGKQHLCVVDSRNLMLCLEVLTNKKPIPMESQHKIWFEESWKSKGSSNPNDTASHISSSRSVLHPDDLGKVYEQIYKARVQWKNIGLQLGLHPATLDSIEHDRHYKAEPCCLDMLKKWLTKGKDRSWNKLADVLQSQTVHFPDMAKDIKKQYLDI